MLIDCHTHIFPDRIAASTVAHLSQVGNMPAHTDGTAEGLRRSMSDAGIDLAIVLPVVTKPSQFESINRFAAEINAQNDRLISFGGIHPDNDDIEQKLDAIVALGLKGIKLHPDYQGVFIDDERYLRILQGAVDRDLYVTIHAGIDIGLPDPVHASPDRVRAMLDIVKQPNGPHILLAHTGGYGCWDDVERLLVGQDVYFDLSFSFGRIDEEQLLRIIRDHGAERILFATDSPWDAQENDRVYFERLPLTADERDAVAYKNACRILGLSY
ncbi:MAG: amidohydrolase family protein [Clostridia bacterium]|nr:amidohydrolase family protein [Clostridia bacterium]